MLIAGRVSTWKYSWCYNLILVIKSRSTLMRTDRGETALYLAVQAAAERFVSSCSFTYLTIKGNILVVLFFTWHEKVMCCYRTMISERVEDLEVISIHWRNSTFKSSCQQTFIWNSGGENSFGRRRQCWRLHQLRHHPSSGALSLKTTAKRRKSKSPKVSVWVFLHCQSNL